MERYACAGRCFACFETDVGGFAAGLSWFVYDSLAGNRRVFEYMAWNGATLQGRIY